MRIARFFVACCILSVLAIAPMSSCAKAPPNLSPAGAQAWYATRVVKGLDVLRDTAIDANNQTPPLLTTAETRCVVTTHQTILQTMQAKPSGWPTTVSTALDGLTKPGCLSARSVAILTPYVAVVKTALQEVK